MRKVLLQVEVELDEDVIMDKEYDDKLIKTILESLYPNIASPLVADECKFQVIKIVE